MYCTKVLAILINIAPSPLLVKNMGDGRAKKGAKSGEGFYNYFTHGNKGN